MADIPTQKPPAPPHIAEPIAEARAKIETEAAEKLKELQKPIEKGRIEARRTLAKRRAEATKVAAKAAEKQARRADLPGYGAAYRTRVERAEAGIKKGIETEYGKGIGDILKQAEAARTRAETAVGEAKTKALADIATVSYTHLTLPTTPYV